MNSNAFQTILAAVAVAGSAGASAQDQQDPPNVLALKQLPIDELLNISVTSVSRKPMRFVEAATAIDVLTGEEIRRSGANTLPDALRLATGVHVAEYDGQNASHTWSVSARGLNRSGNKMQVLLDGRSLYTPLLSGVLWDAQDVFLEDLDRIEVIRGPGATMWGANAVNGVINIVTKSARDTQGALLYGGGGTEERGFGGVRYGGKLGESTFYRVYTKTTFRDDLRLSNGRGAQDPTHMTQGGFRVDSDLTDENLLTVQGDTYYSENEILGLDETMLRGGNLLARWTRTFSAESDLQVQAYYDNVQRDQPQIGGEFRERRHTFDLDLQHRFPIGERNDIVWGFNYRNSSDRVDNTPSIAFVPDERTVELTSFFVQDEIAIVPDVFGVTVGTKLEYNTFTHWEVQPSIRAAFTPTEEQTLWAAISRAVRTPSRLDDDLRIPFPGAPFFVGNPNFQSEELIAYELGYRIQPHRRVSFDVATFYNDFDELRSLDATPPIPPGVPVVIGNSLRAEVYGVELAVDYQPFDWWFVRASYAFARKDVDHAPGSTDITGGTAEGNDPQNLFTLHSSVDIGADVAFDTVFRYVDALPDPHVPSYLVMDIRLAWRPRENLELAVVGRNLLDRAHQEFARGGLLQTEVQHSVYGKVTWTF